MVSIMYEIARAAFAQMPPACRIRETDAQIIKQNQEALLALEPDLNKGFYDTLYDHGPTREVFTDDERPAREETLANWWRRTVVGPLDEEYFAWMAMVGLVHVARKVSNPMMISMASYVATFVAEKATMMGLEREQEEALAEAFSRLAATVGAVISYGYDQAVLRALYEVAGMPPALLQRLQHREVMAALDEARAARGTSL